MPGREFDADPEAGGESDHSDDASTGTAAASVSFRYGRNWTAVAFFGALGSLHLGMAITAMLSSHWESHLSEVFGAVFLCIAVCCALVRHEVIVRADRRRVSVRTGLGRVRVEQTTPFADVTCVRVTLLGRSQRESRVAIVCEADEIELPPSQTPRQQGLLLAMTMGVRLVKVYGDGPPPEPAQRIANLYRNEDAI